MVNSCSANGCKNKNTKGGTLTFHRFPLNNNNLLKLWLYQIKRGTWEPSKYSVICSEHFTENSFVTKGPNRRTLKNDAYPTIFTVANYTEPPKKKRVGRDRNPINVDISNPKEEEPEKKEEITEKEEAIDKESNGKEEPSGKEEANEKEEEPINEEDLNEKEESKKEESSPDNILKDAEESN